MSGKAIQLKVDRIGVRNGYRYWCLIKTSRYAQWISPTKLCSTRAGAIRAARNWIKSLEGREVVVARGEVENTRKGP